MLKLKMLVGAVLAAASTPSMAATTWYQFSGVVTQELVNFAPAAPNPAQPAAIGDQISGRFLWDDTVQPGSFFFLDGPIKASQLVVTRGGAQRVTVTQRSPYEFVDSIALAFDNSPTSSADAFVAQVGGNNPGTLSLSSGFGDIVSADWRLYFSEKCTTGSNFTNDCAVTNRMFDLTDNARTVFDMPTLVNNSEFVYFGVNFKTANGDLLISQFLVQNLSPVSVPEPATWAMTIVGFGAVGGAVRASRTSAKLSTR
jgi:hypothetical protein